MIRHLDITFIQIAGCSEKYVVLGSSTTRGHIYYIVIMCSGIVL